MQRAVGGGLVEPADEVAVPLRDVVGVAGGARLAQPPHQRLRGRAPAKVLEPLTARLADTLLLLPDVRQSRRMVAAALRILGL